MSESTLVVGGGAIGLAVAWEMARRGDRVTLLEREKHAGKGTSWAAAGILPPANLQSATDPIDRLRGLSHDLYPDWCDQLMAATGIDPGFRRCGGWYLADTPGERASMIGMTDYWRDLQMECQRVDSRELIEREPNLSAQKHLSDNLDAWWVPDECQIRCPDYLSALTAACRNSGVEIVCGTEVEDIRWNSKLAGVRSGGRWLESDRVVLCGGVWTGRIASLLKLQRSLVPVRGQIVLFKTAHPLLRSVVNVGHRYVLCRDDGHTLIGSCEEEVGFQLGTTDEMLESLRQFAFDLVPKLSDATMTDAWSGLRPMTFDGFPMIGRLPESENVFVAAGHFRSGIHLSPGTAVTLCDLMTGQTPSVDLDSFRIGKQQSNNADTVFQA